MQAYPELDLGNKIGGKGNKVSTHFNIIIYMINIRCEE